MVGITILSTIGRKSEPPMRLIIGSPPYPTTPKRKTKAPAEAQLGSLPVSPVHPRLQTCSFSASPRTPKHNPAPKSLYMSGPYLGYSCLDRQSPVCYPNPPSLSDARSAPWKQSAPPQPLPTHFPFPGTCHTANVPLDMSGKFYPHESFSSWRMCAPVERAN